MIAGGGVAKAALSALGASATISYVAGAGGYVIEEIWNNRSPSLKGILIHGGAVALEGIWNFGVGGVAGSVGHVGTNGKPFCSPEWYGKLGFKIGLQQPIKIGIDLLRNNWRNE